MEAVNACVNVPIYIKIGENRLVTRFLKKADKTTAQPLSEIAYCSVELRQSGVLKARYTLAGGPSALRAGSDGESVVMEITSAFTRTLKEGAVEEIWTLKKSNSAFVTEPGVEVHIEVVGEIVMTKS